MGGGGSCAFARPAQSTVLPMMRRHARRRM
jgi:hypothetical protein